MATKPKQEKPESEDAIMERMSKALNKMMDTPHETQKEMIERRREAVRHKSDCAVHDAPAYEAGACTCGADRRVKARR